MRRITDRSCSSALAALAVALPGDGRDADLQGHGRPGLHDLDGQEADQGRARSSSSSPTSPRVHNFHLTAPGVNVKTGVSAIGSKTFTVTLKKGTTYRFVCDPHASSMKGSFKVS